MDQELAGKLAHAGIGLGGKPSFPRLAIPTTAEGTVAAPIGDLVLVAHALDEVIETAPKPVQALWTGSKIPPSFSDEPTSEYMDFFMLLEATAVAVTSAQRRLETDAEMLRIYTMLRRRPDGNEPSPMFGHLRGAARLYMSLVDTSRAEYEAVMGRLSRSARHFAFGNGVQSRNYLTQLCETFAGG